MSESAPDSPPPICGANFWIRAVAHTIDFIILFFITCLIGIPLVIRAIQQGMAADPTGLSYPIWVDLVYQLVLAVVVIGVWRKFQTTPGKALFRLRIVDQRDGSKPSVGKLTVRFIGYLVAMVPIPAPFLAMLFPGLLELPHFGILFEKWQFLLPLMLGYFWIFVDSRNRGWHDLMSGTLTVQSTVTSAPPRHP